MSNDIERLDCSRCNIATVKMTMAVGEKKYSHHLICHSFPSFRNMSKQFLAHGGLINDH